MLATKSRACIQRYRIANLAIYALAHFADLDGTGESDRIDARLDTLHKAFLLQDSERLIKVLGLRRPAGRQVGTVHKIDSNVWHVEMFLEPERRDEMPLGKFVRRILSFREGRKCRH